MPIWVGGDLRRSGVRRGLTRWDGACVYRDRALNPADDQDIVNLMHTAGRDLARYDIKSRRQPHPAGRARRCRGHLVGQWIPPGRPDDARKVIADGPPGRADRAVTIPKYGPDPRI